jgi:2-polyprenyl-3-methyl-5-hydroxy-6-metoxy-1,4-benzoquinol methylase
VAELEQIYADQEYFKGLFYTDYLADKATLQLNFQHRLDVVRRFQSGGRLFEAGCAYGFFLELAQRYWSVEGIDFSEPAVAYARDTLKLNVRQGDFESHPPEPNAFDAVVMWDAIEHLYDPALAVRKSAEALKPGGILALTTGDIDALLPRLQKRSWRLFIPQHLYYFSRRSLTCLMENNGLEVIHVSHAGNYRSVHQMAEILTWRHPDSAWRQNLKRQLLRLPWKDWQIPLNLYDIIFLIARKPGSPQT